MKIKTLLTISMVVFFAMFFTNAATVIILVNKMNLDGRVVNYSGIVRGATQRLVKLEMAGVPSDQIISRLDKIIEGLLAGDRELNLPAAKDKNYIDQLKDVQSRWNRLKGIIVSFRNDPQSGQMLLQASEEYFEATDRMVSAAEEFSLGKVVQLKIDQIILSLGSVILVFIVFTLIRRKIKRPLEAAEKIVTEVTEEGNYSSRIEIKGRDEINFIASNLNKILDNTCDLVKAIKEQSNLLSSVGTDLSVNMNESAAAINQISANIQSLKNQITNQSASVIETITTMEQIVGNIEKLNSQIEQQSLAVNQSSSAIEEMVANISSVTKMLNTNAREVEQLTSSSEKGRIDLQAVSTLIKDVAKESRDLIEISSVIQDIAGQTNLLSMNAAIEAAHAGESGRGFAVVADEIRKLAESSGNQAKTISSVLNKIQKALETINASTDSVLVQFESIDLKIKSVSEQEQNIRNSMDEQNAGSQEILNSISKMSDVTATVTNSSKEMMIGSNQVLKESENLNRLTAEISGSMNEMAAGATEISLAINNVNELTVKNRQSIEALVEEVEKYRVE